VYGTDFRSSLQTFAEYNQRSTCNGDSDGPIFALTPKAAYLVRIVSWAEGCARKGKPSVYTRVLSFSEWMAKITSHLGC